ncbi:hypothetical protein GKE82_21865 [Conexibacter sp. W3-3-2]|uniref:hypothetical protein n=1 Tax=Conexibacter sp. W3-3-2 TaxID=2675227 RepID=UPI0012B6C094|nr:hypothetical protein [Conexibacter sp. W3-3-2]MTD46864.1 hypothetical protein [Conexibacter sp. W3-3-2]
MVVIEDIEQIPRHAPGRPPAGPGEGSPGHGGGDDHAARRTLRAQVKRLERELGDALIAAFPRTAVDVRVPAVHRGPQLLGIAELEALRDDLAEKLREARRVVHERGEEEERNRDLLERMLRDPKRYKFARLPNRDLGESGCGVWQVRPRLGLIGMLAGWWHVKLSSGCPLPRCAPRRPAGRSSSIRRRWGSGHASERRPAPPGPPHRRWRPARPSAAVRCRARPGRRRRPTRSGTRCR